MPTNKDLWKIKLISNIGVVGLKLSPLAPDLIEEIMDKVSQTPPVEQLTACPNCDVTFSNIQSSCGCGLLIR